MKNVYIIVLSVWVLFSCSNDDNNAIIAFNPVNEAPTVPNLVYPTNNLVCTNFRLGFNWDNAIDKEEDTVSYQIDIAVEETFSTLLFSVITSQTNRAFTLEKGIAYYWRVRAIDNKNNASEYSPTQTFFTEPEPGVNTIPEPPSLVSPDLKGAVSGNSTRLEWNTTDSDGGALLFDIYFGDTNPPALVAQDINVSTFDVNISINTTYYWRIVAKDDQQGVAISQIWNFRTN